MSRGAERRAAGLLLGPALAFYAAFFVFPVGFTAYAALTDWDMLRPLGAARFVGLENFRHLVARDPLFAPALRATLLLAVGQVALTLALGLGIATLVAGRSGGRAWKTVYFLPVITSVVVVGEVWRYLYHPTAGLLNGLLRAAGLPGLDWLTSTALALPSVILAATWASLGGAVLILATALEDAPRSVFEAAALDGAGAWRRFRHITLPLLRPAITFVAVTGLIASLQAFALVLILTGGGPGNATRVLALHMYETAFTQLRMGRASAMVLLLVALVLPAVLLLLRRLGDEE